MRHDYLPPMTDYTDITGLGEIADKLVDGADHRFSDEDCLALIVSAVEDVTARA